MSYIQKQIGGKLRGLKFNQMAILLMSEYADTDNYVATGMYAIVFAGLKANAYVKREEFVDKVEDKETPITFEQVCDWVDEISIEDQKEILTVFNETQVYKNLIEKGKKVEADSKKKLKASKGKT